jgi:DNA-directed RNA polymerase subunit RPC12/RpoP
MIEEDISRLEKENEYLWKMILVLAKESNSKNEIFYHELYCDKCWTELGKYKIWNDEKIKCEKCGNTINVFSQFMDRFE